MIESPLGLLIDEFSPDESDEEAVDDDEPIPVPVKVRRKRRPNFHPGERFHLCPCPDCMRQRPGRAAAIASRKVGK